MTYTATATGIEYDDIGCRVFTSTQHAKICANCGIAFANHYPDPRTWAAMIGYVDIDCDPGRVGTLWREATAFQATKMGSCGSGRSAICKTPGAEFCDKPCFSELKPVRPTVCPCGINREDCDYHR